MPAGAMAGVVDVCARLLRALPAESAHRMTVNLLRMGRGFLPGNGADDPRLAVAALGRTFPNPIGVAAGFDKDAKVPDAIVELGFGFAECGTVTPCPQPGNPRPRLFRLVEDRAVVNRMGFNNAGMERAAGRLSRRPRRAIVGINIGANKNSSDRLDDYAVCFSRLAPLVDYVVVNVSSPNTPGLRGLQSRDDLERLLGVLCARRGAEVPGVPILLKIAPDVGEAEMDDIAAVTLASGIEGLVVSNTTIARPATLRSPRAKEAGGLSGAPLFGPSTAVLRAMRRRVGARLLLVGVGGVDSGAAAYAKIRAGATLVQLYTALAYEGPGLVHRIKRELAALLARDGFARVGDAVGIDV